MGNLFIKSASDKKYWELNMLLINVMAQGHNRYPNSKDAAYTMFCKYVPERINNKNYSTTMCDRPAMGASLYQHATPIDGTSVAGKKCMTEDMITCWKCGRCGHRSQFLPKADDKGFQGTQFIFKQGINT